MKKAKLDQTRVTTWSALKVPHFETNPELILIVDRRSYQKSTSQTVLNQTVVKYGAHGSMTLHVWVCSCAPTWQISDLIQINLFSIQIHYIFLNQQTSGLHHNPTDHTAT